MGKAVSLRRRVQSYFTDRDFGYDTERLGAMVAQIADVEYLLTANELEALILESNLIKERRPRYNIVLRDDKHYPFIRLNPKDPFPALQVVRRIRRDGALYFGPYVPAGTMWNLLALIHRTFPLRTCRSIAGRTRCLEYHLGRCQAPCEGLVTPDEYGQTVQKVRLLLEGQGPGGRSGSSRRRCERRRNAWSSSARPGSGTRSRPCAGPGKGQRAISARGEDQDVFGVAQEGHEAQVQLLLVRGGKLIGRDRFAFEAVLAGFGQAPLLGALLPQYYLGAREIPRTILTSHPPSDRDLARGHALGPRRSTGDAEGAGAGPQGPARGNGGRQCGGRVGSESGVGARPRARHGGGPDRARLAAPPAAHRVYGYLQHLGGAGGGLAHHVCGRPARAGRNTSASEFRRSWGRTTTPCCGRYFAAGWPARNGRCRISC